jgi:hypothetical protein
MPYSRARSPIPVWRRSSTAGTFTRKIDAKTGGCRAVSSRGRPGDLSDQKAGDVELTDIKVSEATAIGLIGCSS